MKRRDFLVAAGAAMGGLATARTASASTPSGLTPAETQRLNLAVKGGFGPGFRVHAADRDGGRIVALIEHNENFLEVATPDLQSFTVLRATPM